MKQSKIYKLAARGLLRKAMVNATDTPGKSDHLPIEVLYMAAGAELLREKSAQWGKKFEAAVQKEVTEHPFPNDLKRTPNGLVKEDQE